MARCRAWVHPNLGKEASSNARMNDSISESVTFRLLAWGDSETLVLRSPSDPWTLGHRPGSSGSSPDPGDPRPHRALTVAAVGERVGMLGVVEQIPGDVVCRH